jgi:predicted RNase H-like nuclease (RuvC/YqgF family)
MAREYEKTYEKFMVDTSFEKLTREEFEQVLKYSKALEFKDTRIQNDANRIKEYHYMVNAYKAEIQRLDSIINERDATIREQKARIEDYEVMEKKYQHLIESRKLQMLDKIGFIDMEL